MLKANFERFPSGKPIRTHDLVTKTENFTTRLSQDAQSYEFYKDLVVHEIVVIKGTRTNQQHTRLPSEHKGD